MRISGRDITLCSLLFAITSAITSALDFVRECLKRKGVRKKHEQHNSTDLVVFIVTEAAEMSFLHSILINLAFVLLLILFK
jgi:hypothetical protein